MNLDKITSENVADFAAHRQGKGLQVSSVNRSLQVLRRVLRSAVEWGVIPTLPKIKLFRGERHRERVVTRAEEARYLAAAPEPLASIATILIDSGMRPEECFRLKWESVTWVNGRNGTMLVTHGKTAAARRASNVAPSEGNPRKSLEWGRDARSRLGVGRTNQERPRRTEHTEKAARQYVQDHRGASRAQ